MKLLYPSLVFPDTDIFSYRQFSLLLFGSPVSVLETVEPDSNENEKEREILIDSGLVQVFNPAPLGEDRDRFLHLVKDIRNRKDDYAAQLSALTIAAMSSKDEETRGEKRYQLISSMLGAPPASLSEANKSELDLWQARLVLEISEILKKEEEELHQELQLLDGQEIEMFKSLHGDGDLDETDPFSEVQRISAHLSQARPREMNMRFRSWLRLMQKGALPEVSLFLASSTDAGDQLINEYERQHDGTAVPILELNLPERIEAGAIHVVSQIQRFHEQSQEVRKRMCRELDSMKTKDLASADSAEMLLPAGPDFLGRWNELVEDHFPSSSHGSASLLFYLLPRAPITDLLNLQADAATPPAVNGVFAALKD